MLSKNNLHNIIIRLNPVMNELCWKIIDQKAEDYLLQGENLAGFKSEELNMFP